MFQSVAMFIMAFFKGGAHGAQTLANLLATANTASANLLKDQLDEFELDQNTIDDMYARTDALIGIKPKAPKEPTTK